MIADGMKRTISYCREKNLDYYDNKRYITINIEESDIAELLIDLSNKKIDYQEISIKKPGLEDFFLNIAERKKDD